MAVWEDGTDARIEFHARELNLPELGHIVENNVIVSALAEKLSQNYNARILEGVSITGCNHDSGRVVLETGHSISSRLILLAWPRPMFF